MCETLLATVGLVSWVEDESLMDAVTALSGSGPAYIFHMVEAMAQAGEAAGLPAEQAMLLARQTVIGAGFLLDASEETAATLRQNVTSPGGTTAAALDVLMDQTTGLPELMTRAVEAARKRSVELAG
jgi:pyrroline-5-carboxylate reductase